MPAKASEYVMRVHGDAHDVPLALRVVEPGKMLHADVPGEIALDLDGDGLDDIWVSMHVVVKKAPMAELETSSCLRVTGRNGVAFGIAGPLQPGDVIKRSDQFYRAVTPAHFQGNGRTEFFFGAWVRDPESMSGILPVRLIGDNDVHLGYLAMELDGYGNLTSLSHALSIDPIVTLDIPESAFEKAPTTMPSVEETAPTADDTPSTLPDDWRIVMN